MKAPIVANELRGIHIPMNDLTLVERTFLKDLCTEHTMLVMMINYVLVSKEIPDDVKKHILTNAGEHYFLTYEDGSIIFKGLS